jgi:predicted dehydrogenase
MSKRLLILGGGFGLYGYLPSAIAARWEVTTLSRYQGFLQSREVLKDYCGRVDFVDEEELVLTGFSGIVIARTPSTQSEFITSTPNFSGHFFLEKPLGLDSKSHLALVTHLRESSQKFSVGYLFRYLDWYKAIISAMKSDREVLICWQIPYSDLSSWKSNSDLGGGLLSYYGIHILSLLVDLGITEEDLECSVQDESIELFTLDKTSSLRIKLEFADEGSFGVYLNNRPEVQVFESHSPFGFSPSSRKSDPRIPALTAYLSDWDKPSTHENPLSHELKVVKLRKSIEDLL